MELDADGRIFGTLDCLDDSVRRTSRHREAAAEFPDGLVVARIDAELRPPEVARDPRIRLKLDRMLAAVGKAMALLRAALELGRQILPESSAKVDVEQLCAAADAEYRLPMRNGCVKNGPLPCVPPLVDFAKLRRWLLAVARGIDILAAAEDKRVAPRDHLGDLRLVVRIFKDDRLEARALHVVDILPRDGFLRVGALVDDAHANVGGNCAGRAEYGGDER